MEDLQTAPIESAQQLDSGIGQLYGIASDYPTSRKLLAARRQALGLSQLALDELIGWPDGCASKIEEGMKNLGNMSFENVLSTLEISLALVPSAGRDRRLERQIKALNQSLCSRMRKLGRAGGRATRASMTDANWSEHCRRANKIRWRKWREAKAEKARRLRRRKSKDVQVTS